MDTICQEFYLGEIISITAVPVSDLTLSTAAIFAPRILSGQWQVNYANAITIGTLKRSSETLVPIIRRSGKAKDEERDEVSGRSHSVDVSCEADDRAPSSWSALRRLERGPFHLVLGFKSGGTGVVTSDRDSYSCYISRDGSETTVSFKLHNLSGIQIVG